MFHEFRVAAVAAVMSSAVAVVPMAAQAAGAMAVGACGAYGYAFDFADATKARATALARCKGKGCRVAVVMKKSCAAFAVDLVNVCGAHGYSEARHLAQAQNAALRHCYRYGGRECVVRAWACDVRG